MAKQFFYQAQGEAVGPLSGVELRDKALACDVFPYTLIRIDDGGWVPASRLKNLFDKDGRPISHADIDRLERNSFSSNGVSIEQHASVAATRNPPTLPVCGGQNAKAASVLGSLSQTEPRIASRGGHESRHLSRSMLIGLWSVAGSFLLGAILFLVFDIRANQQDKIAAANNRISQSVAAANSWLAGNSALNGESVERELLEALQDDMPTDRSAGETLLEHVRQRRAALREQTHLESLRQEATAIFNTAKRQMESKQLVDAMGSLNKYVAHPYATEKTNARCLLSEATIASSDKLTYDALMAMSEEEFDRTGETGEINDGQVVYGPLVAIRKDSVQRNLAKASQVREEVRLAAAKRRESERLAAIEGERSEELSLQIETEKQHLAARQQIAQERRQQEETKAKEKQFREAIAKELRRQADIVSDEASTNLTTYFTTLSAREKRELEPALAAILLMRTFWSANQMDDPEFHSTLKRLLTYPETMRGILRLRPIVGAMVYEREDGTWTTSDLVIDETLKIIREKGLF